MKPETLNRLVADTLRVLKQEGMSTFCRFARMGSRPRRFVGRAAYRGGNAIALWATAMLQDYGSPIWLTYKQAAEAGAQVRKGEKGTTILYADRWKPEGSSPDDPGRLFMRAYTVFNAAQVEGLPADCYCVPVTPIEFDPIPEAEAFVLGTSAKVQERADGAWFMPSKDLIGMPHRKAFADAEGWYATLMHELVHWSGAENRLNRVMIPRHKDKPAYAREELIAEIGAAMLCADLKLSPEPREDHAVYLADWLKVLGEEPMELWSAARAAETAADYLWQLQPQEDARRAA